METKNIQENSREFFEYGFLGSFIQSPDGAADAAVGCGLASPEFIQNQILQCIYETGLLMLEDGVHIDQATIYGEVTKRFPNIDKAVLASTISRALDVAVAPSAADYYAKAIVEFHISHRIVQEVNRLKGECETIKEPARFAERIAQRFLGIAQIGTDAESLVISAPSAIAKATERLEEIEDATSNSVAKFDIPSLDKTVMLLPKMLVTIAARPSIGKTALAGQLALNAARSGIPTLFVTLEMPVGDIVQRMLAHMSGVSFRSIRHGMHPDELGKFIEAKRAFAKLPIYFIERGTITASTIASHASRLAETCGVKLLIIDYVQLVLTDKRCDTRELEVAYVYDALRRLTTDAGIATVALAQLNRESEKTDRRPKLSDIRETGKAEADSDAVLLMHRPKEGICENEVDIIVGKNRNGQLGTAYTEFQGECFRFVERKPITDV